MGGSGTTDGSEPRYHIPLADVDPRGIASVRPRGPNRLTAGHANSSLPDGCMVRGVVAEESWLEMGMTGVLAVLPTEPEMAPFCCIEGPSPAAGGSDSNHPWCGSPRIYRRATAAAATAIRPQRDY